jgi:hypothetical protein
MFCDDVRRELGGKFTFIGCYGSDMYLNSFPATLTKLSVHWQAVAPLSDPFVELRVRLLRGEELLFEVEADPDALAQSTVAAAAGRTRMIIGGFMELPFLELGGPTTLELEGEFNGGKKLLGPKMHVSLVPEQGPA